MVDISIWANLSFYSKMESELEVANIHFSRTFFHFNHPFLVGHIQYMNHNMIYCNRLKNLFT